jgi:poly(A) polymerase
MILPDASWRQRAGMANLLKALDAEAGQSRFVGGCVRDTLLQLPVSDIDIATRLTPDEVMNRLRAAEIKVVPTGIDHGTVTAVLHGAPVEITTLRRDVSTDGRRATIAFTEDWREDAARRDFTINALFADPGSGEIYDFFDGLADLHAGRVRFIGEPLRRIAEDHLRILRFFRFHARFGTGEPDTEALEACTARANDLMALSRERVADELLKLLALPAAPAAVRLMVERKILAPVIPEIEKVGVARLDHLAAREAAMGLQPAALRRLAALLPPVPETARAIASRLRLSKRAANRLDAAAAWALPAPQDPQLLAYRIGLEGAIDRLLIGDQDEAELKEALTALGGWERPQLGLGGGDLIAMGLPPGPLVSRALQAIETEWAESGFPGDRQSIREIAERRVAQLLRSSQ